MRLVFGVDVTDKNNRIIDAEKFIAQELSGKLEETYQELNREVSSIDKQTTLPKVLRGVRYISRVSIFAIPAVLIESCADNQRNRSNNKSGYAIFLLLWFGMIAITLLLDAYEVWRTRRVVDGQKFQDTEQRAGAFTKEALAVLGVPENAVQMDVLAAYYRREGYMMYSTYSRLIWYYDNISMYVWRKENVLCFADSTLRMEIPLDAFRSAEIIKKGYYISKWNQKEAFRSQEYKRYRIHRVQGEICVPKYMAVRLLYKDNEYEMRVPPWEVESLRRITGWDLK